MRGGFRFVVLVLPYWISGLSAPLIFKLSSTPQLGGHIAGFLFSFAGAWSLFVASARQWRREWLFPLGLNFSLQLVFWLWRFMDDLPLKEATLWGLTGSNWHGLLTILYLAIGVAFTAGVLLLR